jgi:tetratricopeptide (TPR) repeat protein
VRAFREKPAMLQVDRLLEHGQAEEALALLEEERARGTDDGATALQIARVLQRMGRKQDALREIEGALAREPENSKAMLMKANLLDDSGDPAAAVALLERVTTLQPSFGGAFAAKGQKLFQLGRHAAAVTALQRALELGAGDYEVRHTLGRSLIVLKRWPEARELFTKLVAERDDDGDAWLELATVQLRSGALPEAEASLARALATGNASPELLEDVQRVQANTRERRAAKKAAR